MGYDIGQRGIKGKGISDDDVYEMRDGDDLWKKAFGTSGRKRGGKKPFDFLLSIASWLTYWIGIQSRLEVFHIPFILVQTIHSNIQSSNDSYHLYGCLLRKVAEGLRP